MEHFALVLAVSNCKVFERVQMKNVFTSQLVIRIVSIYDNLIKLLLLFQSDELSPPDAPRIKTFEGNHSETVIFITT